MLRIERLNEIPDDIDTEEVVDAGFHRAFRAAGIPGLDYGCIAAYRDGVRVTVVPYFTMDFAPSATMPDSLLKKCLGWFHFRLVCVDHPAPPTGVIYGEASAEVLEAVNAELRKLANLVVYKGFDASLPLRGFVCARGHPLAMLYLQGDYWSQLPGRTRNNLRRKLRDAKGLRFAEVAGSELVGTPLVEQIHALYLNVEARSDLKFVQMNPAYFEQLAPITRYVLAYEGERLVGFLQFGHKKPRMALWLVGLDYEANERHGVYFPLFIHAIECAVRDGFESIEMGITSYQFKRMLGCTLVETGMHYHHNNRLIHWMLGRLRNALGPTEQQLL